MFYIDRNASVQFIHPIFFRMIRPLDWDTYHGWRWLEGYELNKYGDAVDRRTIFVMPHGLRRVPGIFGARRLAGRPTGRTSRQPVMA